MAKFGKKNEIKGPCNVDFPGGVSLGNIFYDR